eukprot:3958610-Prymnesium_polylepis.2
MAVAGSQSRHMTALSVALIRTRVFLTCIPTLPLTRNAAARQPWCSISDLGMKHRPVPRCTYGGRVREFIEKQSERSSATEPKPPADDITGMSRLRTVIMSE